MVKYSVLVICYNQQKFIAQSIESLLGQKYDEVEFIISDDCSSDDTWKIINSYSDTRLRKFRQPKNLGINENSNYLFREAKGDFICLLGGDDYLLGDNFFEILDARIHQNPQIDCWVYGKTSSENGFDATSPIFNFGIQGKALVKKIILGKAPFFLFQQVVFKRAENPLQFPPQGNKYAYGEDIDLLFSLLKGSRCAPVGESLIFYRVGVGITAEANKLLTGFYLHNLMIRRWVADQCHCDFTHIQVKYVIAREYLRVINEMPDGEKKKAFIKENFNHLEVVFGRMLSMAEGLPGPLRRFLKSFL